MLKISTSNSASLTLTGSHVVFRKTAAGALESVFASQLVVGDELVRPNMEGKPALDEVFAIQHVLEEKGYWAPLTQDGTLLVNGLLVSCYASFPHHQSQLVFALVKTFPRLLLDGEVSQHEDGVRHVVTLVKKIGERWACAGWSSQRRWKTVLTKGNRLPIKSLCVFHTTTNCDIIFYKQFEEVRRVF